MWLERAKSQQSHREGTSTVSVGVTRSVVFEQFPCEMCLSVPQGLLAPVSKRFKIRWKTYPSCNHDQNSENICVYDDQQDEGVGPSLLISRACHDELPAHMPLQTPRLRGRECEGCDASDSMTTNKKLPGESVRGDDDAGESKLQVDSKPSLITACSLAHMSCRRPKTHLAK